MPSKRTFMDVAIGDAAPQRIMFELDADRVPKTVENFRALCTGEKGMSASAPDKPLHYKGTIFHRVIDMFMLQSGDFEKGNGSGGESIYGKTFEDEDLGAPLDKAGLLAMANRGKDTNSSQFFITLDECPHLDGKHTLFGRVVKGMEVVEQIAKVDVDGKDKPLKDVVIVNCGELIKKSAVSAVQADVAPTRTITRDSRSRSRSPDPTRTASRSKSPRRRSPSPTPSTSSTASSDSRSRRRRKSKKEKKEKRRSKKDKKSGLKGLVDGYLDGEGTKEETEEELDARLEREENERLDREKKERLEQMKAKLAEEKKQREASGDGGGVVYKGRGSMRYLDPESLASTRGSNGGYSNRDRDGRDYRGSRDRPSHHRDQRDRDSRREREPERRSSRSPPPRRSNGGGGGGGGGVEGDWRVGRDMKIRGLDRDDHQDRGLKGRGLGGFERGKIQDEGLDRRAGVEEDKTGNDARSGAGVGNEARAEVDVREETREREQRRGERRGSEESMEMDLDE